MKSLKSLSPQRRRIVVYYLLSVFFMVASLVERHLRAGMEIALPTEIAVVFFMLAATYGRYNLTDE